MRCLVLAIVATLLSPAVSAEGPVAKIEGPEVIAIGQLATFRSASTGAESLAWLCLPATRNWAVDSSGQCAFLASGDGSGGFTVLLIALGDGRLSVTQHAVAVGTGPNPEPEPQPEPEPEPLSPLAASARDWCLAEVPVDGRAAAAKALVGSFRASAAKIGPAMTPRQIVEMTFAANRQAVPGYERWQKWGRRLADYLNAEHAAGRLVQPAQYRAAWIEIGKGLEAVR